MKTQINNLVKGDHRNQTVGTPSEQRSLIASKVISENSDKMTIFIKGETVELKANWSVSRKSVTYFAEIPVHLYVKYFGTFGLPKNDPKAYIIINGDMTVTMSTNSRKAFHNYINESEITIL
jgi:hypothetical protein